MKRIVLSTVLASALLALTPLLAAPPVSPEQQQLAAVLKELQTQQAAITENQAKIDAKLATLAEVIRVAKIYSSRSGR